MKTIHAINHKGIRVIGISESEDEVVASFVASAIRAYFEGQVEKCESDELVKMAVAGILHHAPDNIPGESEFWRIVVRH